ncbi:hypothetical protein F5883DRAFT_436293 [Diaporthe sp. PMI_573]|nr:hypothetical protein F5883DRAFT_436293 [Diaporthaceae sp. PMI_573]
MPASKSFLSSGDLGYDVVVATTQASINSSLLEYLSGGKQPTTYICFLADPQTGLPSQLITLDDLLTKTNNVNPFDIPDGTAYDDARITTLTKALFICGIKFQMGLPPGVLPKNLPAPVVQFGSSNYQVGFTMYCSQFSVVENSPLTGFGVTGKWSVWSQPPGDPWYVQTTVNLVTQELPQDLDTRYFAQNPDLKSALQGRLLNLGSGGFSLQQLLLDLENATPQSVPSFGGIPAGSYAESILLQSFVSIYGTSAKQYGEPLVAVQALWAAADPSQLAITGTQLQVNPYIDEATGDPVADPTPLQKAAATLSYLCAANNDALPAANRFNWNWVDAMDVDMESGAIAIKRDIIGNFIIQQLRGYVKSSCIAATTSVSAHWWGDVDFGWSLTNQQTPQMAGITAAGSGNGSNVIHIEYSSIADNSDQSGLIVGRFEIAPKYTCDVAFSGSTFTVTQQIIIYVFVLRNRSSIIDPIDIVDLNIVNKTITDVYTISVGQNGDLLTTHTGTTSRDDSQHLDPDPVRNFFTGIDDFISDAQNKMSGFAATNLNPIDFSMLRNFVFPGGRVFTYKSASFSDYQDLLCSITYVNTPLNQIPQAATACMANAASSADTPLTLTYSSEMMQNYLQGEVVSPQSKFEALQTDDGHALLFAMTTAGVLNVMEEQTGQTANGWALTDLSTALIARAFRGGTVRTFDVGQSALDGTIGLAMAVSFGNADNLCVSLSNSSADTSWTAAPKWTVYPFDAPGGAPATISIAGILFSETLDNQQYLVIDIDRSPSSPVRDIVRYCLDPSKAAGTYWVRNDVPIDIEDGNYQSCVGRAANALVDGVYTSGTAAGDAQLVYVPLVNVFGLGPPTPNRMGLPGGALASAIAAARDTTRGAATYGTSDLYAIGNSTLYRFTAEDQNTDSTVGTALITNDVLAGTDTLIAMTHDGVTTLWGRNASDAVYYLSCVTDQVASPGAWSAPVPLLTGIERISAYVNRSDGGNTIFASGGGQLQKLIQATDTPAKLWRSQAIHLAAPPRQTSLAFRSYTTMLRAADASDMPARGVNLAISAATRTPVYMNGLYYVLGQTPVTVPTDKGGLVTVIEATDNVNGTVLTVSTGGGSDTATVINPMDKGFRKLAALNTADALQSATIPTGVKAGGIVGPVQTARLVPPSTSGADAQAAAANLSTLQTVYNGVGTPPRRPAVRTAAAARASRVVPSTALLASSSLSPSSFGADIAIAAGDLYQLLQLAAVDPVIQVLYDAISDTYQFLATIGDKAYRALLNTRDAVVGAVGWVFNVIGTAIEDALRFIEFLFVWDDIRRTKDVLHNVTSLYLQDTASRIGPMRKAFDSRVADVEKTVASWAGIQDWSPLGDAAGKPASGNATANATNPMASQTSGSQLLSHHFRDQAGAVSVLGTEPSASVAQALLNDMVTALANQGQVLAEVWEKLHDLINDFGNLSLNDILKRMAGIFAEGMLSSAQVVIDALLDVLAQLAPAAVGLLGTEIYVPVISDILEAIGVPSISFLDLFTWMAAVGYTVVYKITHDDAPPFPDDADTQAVLAARDWTTLAALPLDDASSLKPPQLGIYIAGHMTAGILGPAVATVAALEAAQPTGENDFAVLSAVLATVQAVFWGAAEVFAPRDKIEDLATRDFVRVLTGSSLLVQLVFSGPGQKALASRPNTPLFRSLMVADPRGYGAAADAFLVIASLYCTIEHFYELAQKPAAAEKSAAVIGEVSNVASYFARLSYTGAVNSPDPESKSGFITSLMVSDAVVAVLQIVESNIV